MSVATGRVARFGATGVVGVEAASAAIKAHVTRIWKAIINA
jgi:hypothetical protein